MGTLEVRSLSRIRDGVLVFDEVSFTVSDGRVSALAGPSLAGKTSLLRVIAGVERSDGGDVLLDGQSILRQRPERRRIGFLFDDLALFEDMTVRENVTFGLRMQRRARVDRLRRADDVLDALGLSGRAHRKPRDLTPGERKRLAFARAVAPEPSLLLLDEPTAGVEEVGRETWRQELAQALRALQVTTLIATTDLRDAVTLADDLALMAEGQILQTGTVARVLQGPISIEAATLAGYVPLVRGEVVEGLVIESGVGSIPFPAGFPLRQQAAVMAHPTALFGVPGGSGLGSGVSGTLLRARPDGPVYVVEVQLNDRSVALRWEWDLMPPEPGTLIEIAVRPGTLRFFNDIPAPRVRSAESPVVNPERFAALASRPVAGADAPGPRTAPPDTPDDFAPITTTSTRTAAPVDPNASQDATTATSAVAADRAGQGDLEESSIAAAAAGGTQSESASASAGSAHASRRETETGKARPEAFTRAVRETDEDRPAMQEATMASLSAEGPLSPSGEDTVGERSGKPRGPADSARTPQSQADARPAERGLKPAAEPVQSVTSAVDPVRTRSPRPAPPAEPAPEVHTSSYGPAPAAPPPPKADDRHSGMPLD